MEGTPHRHPVESDPRHTPTYDLASDGSSEGVFKSGPALRWRKEKTVPDRTPVVPPNAAVTSTLGFSTPNCASLTNVRSNPAKEQRVHVETPIRGRIWANIGQLAQFDVDNPKLEVPTALGGPRWGSRPGLAVSSPPEWSSRRGRSRRLLLAPPFRQQIKNAQIRCVGKHTQLLLGRAVETARAPGSA